jgi:sec-independent protein translocase protein TatA
MSGSHLMLLAVVLIVLVLGPAKLPQLGRGLGDAIRGFKKGMAGEDDNEIDITNTTREKLQNTPTEAQAQAQKERERNKV